MLCVHALQAAQRDEAAQLDGTKVAIARLQACAGSTGGETSDVFVDRLRERREDVTSGGSGSGESACAEPPIARQRTREGACESERRDVVQQARAAGLVGHSDGEASGEESSDGEASGEESGDDMVDDSGALSDTPRASDGEASSEESLDGEASGEESGDDMVDGSGALSDTPRASEGEASGEESDENDASTAGSQQQQQAQQQQAQQQQAQQQQGSTAASKRAAEDQQSLQQRVRAPAIAEVGMEPWKKPHSGNLPENQRHNRVIVAQLETSKVPNL